ncbi:MAG: YhcN/YlaJ family sporulation lipoprotein [Dethiobacter sp.]|nr:YhcN/YlaJ family sporulation lipoprotein [Dethiobacter sp.]
MKKRRFVFLVCLLFIVSLLATGCPMPLRRPAPERQPEQAPVPQPAPRQPAPGAMEMANRIANIAADVPGVDAAVVVAISNMALVGITLDRAEEVARGEVEIKQEVARTIEKREPGIVNAYVSANPDIIKQLRDISSGIQRGEPLSTFFEQLAEILRRMRVETDPEPAPVPPPPPPVPTPG